jgi:hypothetical protein
LLESFLVRPVDSLLLLLVDNTVISGVRVEFGDFSLSLLFATSENQLPVPSSNELRKESVR